MAKRQRRIRLDATPLPRSVVCEAEQRIRSSPPIHAISKRLVVSRCSTVPDCASLFAEIAVRIEVWKAPAMLASERMGLVGVFMAASFRRLASAANIQKSGNWI